MLKIYWNEAIKNIRKNLWLNLAITAFIVALMTFAGIICNQLLINDLTMQLKLDQEAFVEYSQYHFLSTEKASALIDGRGAEGNPVPDNERFIAAYPSNDPAVNAKYLRNCDKVWDFYRRLNNIPGVQFETLKNVGYASIKQYDAYEGYTTPDNIKELIVDENFFKLEKLTYLEGREPREEDYYIDKDGFQVVPILVGYQLRDIFHLGDIVYAKDPIEKYDPDSIKHRILHSDSYCKGIVVGILGPSNSVTNSWGDSFYNLSTMIVKPRKIPNPDNFPELKSTNDLYLMTSYRGINEFINGKIYINKTNEAQATEEIRKALEETGLDAMWTLSDTSTYSKVAVALSEDRTNSYLLVAFCIGILCLFGLGILIVMVNIANTKDFSIHRLLGATKRSTAVMTTVQMLLLLLASDILVHYPFILSKTGLFLNGDSMQYIWAIRSKMYLTIAIVNVAVLLVTYVVSRIYTAKIDIVTTIKEGE